MFGRFISVGKSNKMARSTIKAKPSAMVILPSLRDDLDQDITMKTALNILNAEFILPPFRRQEHQQHV